MALKHSLYFALVLGLIFAAAGYVLWGKSFSPAKAQGLQVEKLVVITAGGKKQNFDVELAYTPAQQAYGLMNRKEMPKDHGMLFVFKTDSERSFWMKNTLIPLDMIFIRSDGVIHHIHENALPHDLTPVPSKGRVRAVLEINGGMSAALGIKAGDKVNHKVFSDGS